MRRFLIFLGFITLIALESDQALVGTFGGFESGDRWETRLRLFASQPHPHADPARKGALKVDIPSFGHVGREGDVYLPTRTIRVAIPEGAGRISIAGIHGAATEVPGVIPQAPSPTSGIQGSHPLPDAVSLTKAEARLRAPRAPDGEPREFAPAGEPIRLGDAGYFRDQKFVEVIYTPVVAPP